MLQLNRRRGTAAVVGTLSALLASAGIAFAANVATLPAGAINHPVEVGPTSGDNGFPVWYRDSSNTRLEGCFQAEDPLCAIPLGEVPNPDAPTSWPDNWPTEGFYMLADSTLNLTGGGTATYTTGLEATFASGEPLPGDQITFGRVRIAVRGARANTKYTFSHPYGIDVITTDGTGAGKYVEDVGIGSNGDFTGALKSRIGPFLKWTSGAPAGYIGNPDVLHTVTGSPYLDASGAPQNYFKAVSDAGIATTDQFALAGRLATNAGVTTDSAVYRPNGDGGSIDVFAHSEVDQAIQLPPTDNWGTTTLSGSGGSYYARLTYKGTRPTQVTVVNASDRPATTKTVAVVDAVTVSSAVYDAGSGQLTVSASSTDPAATLTVAGFGALTDAPFTTAAPPAKVTVTSSGGGSDSAPVTGSGAATLALPLRAGIGANGTAHSGDKVMLDGSSSSGDITGYTWSQTAGEHVDLLVAADQKSATFLAPPTAGEVTFALTVSGPGGTTDTASATVNVLETVAPAPVANAGADQTIRLGSTVTLDGSASTATNDYAWAQVDGPAVRLSDPTAAKPTFTMPSAAVSFTLTVTGAGGTATDTVIVNPLIDRLTATARYVASKRQWRIDGTAQVTADNKITVKSTGASGALIGTANVATDGTWSVRVDNSSVPQSAQVYVTSSAGATPITAAVRAG